MSTTPGSRGRNTSTNGGSSSINLASYRFKNRRIIGAEASCCTLQLTLFALLFDLSQGAKDGHADGNSDEAAADSMSTMKIGPQIYLIVVGIVLGAWVVYMACTCRARRIKKAAFEEKLELMKQYVVLDCENSQNNKKHNDVVAQMIAALHDSDESSSSVNKSSPWNGRYESTYMKPWETHKSRAYLTFSARHDGGSGWIMSGSGRDIDGAFTNTEGLLSESGKAYWVEKCDEKGGQVSVTSGTFHFPSMRDCTNTCFNGSWHGENGLRGIYWSFRLAAESTTDTTGEDLSDIDIEA